MFYFYFNPLLYMKGGNIRVGDKIQIPETLTTTTDSDLLYMCQK